jgi:hypothetical protein
MTDTQTDRDPKLDADRLDHLRASWGVSAAEYPVPTIAALRHLYGIGLKEAKDIHDGILMLTDRPPYNDPGNNHRVWRVVRSVDFENINGATGDLKRERDALQDRVESAERFAEALRTERESLVRQVRSLEIDLEVKSLQEEIASRQREIAELNREQDEVRNGGQPWSNLPLDEEPF